MSKLKLTLVTAALVLAGCGGGGGGNIQDSNSFTPSAPRIVLTPQNTSLPANTSQFAPETNSPYLTPITITVLQQDGAVIPDGVLIFLRSNDARTIALSPQTANNALALSDAFCAQSIGGKVGFLLHSGPNAGTAQLTASVTFPPQPGTISDSNGVRTCTQPFNNPGSQSYASSIPFTVTAGPTPFERLTLMPRRTTLPVNTLASPTTDALLTPTSPFVTEVELTFRSIGGALIEQGVANVSINPAIGRFSVPDDPATPLPLNEFLVLQTQGQVQIRAGKAILYFHSRTQTGTSTMTVTATDPVTGAVVSRSITFTISGSGGGLPSQVRITGGNNVVYTRGTNGNNDAQLQITVVDGDGVAVADSSGANLLVEILPVANGSGEVLSAAGVADGSSVRVRTIGGLGQVTYRSGSRQGLVTVRATADRADNNVDNGIQNAVITQTSFVVSDGKLFDLEITSPIINAVRVNGVDPAVDPEPATIDGNEVLVPDLLDGTYALTVSVIATDRQGNPVLENTPIEFGMVDEPASGFPERGPGEFRLAGNDGNPQEGGSLFTAPTGNFTAPGGNGAGPGDTLIVFAENSPGNRDLESARIVQRVNASNSLTIQNRFNFNDDTGNSVDNGAVLPYIIGRNTNGNIGSNVLTRPDGVAVTKMTYPVSQLGKGVVLWARGSGDVVNNSPELVTDAEFFGFPGVAPARLVVSPTIIPANQTSQVSICYLDALRIGLAGFFPDFNVIGSTLTTVDGVAGSGTVARATDRFSGCTVANINTAGVVTANNTRIVFSIGGLSGTVNVAAANTPVLQAIPSQLGGQGGLVTLRLLDGNGAPIPGIQLVGTCAVASSGGGGTGGGTGTFVVAIQTPPGTTNAQGETTSVIGASLDGLDDFGTGTCTFTTAAPGGPTVTVNLRGLDACDIVVSPLCPTTQRTQVTLQVQLDLGPPATPAQGIVTGSAGGINCSSSAPNTGCSGMVDVGTVVRLTAVPGAGFQFCGYSGASECDTTVPVVNVSMNAAKTCVARFRPSSGACSP